MVNSTDRARARQVGDPGSIPSSIRLFSSPFFLGIFLGVHHLSKRYLFPFYAVNDIRSCCCSKYVWMKNIGVIPRQAKQKGMLHFCVSLKLCHIVDDGKELIFVHFLTNSSRAFKMVAPNLSELSMHSLIKCLFLSFKHPSL